MKNQCVKELRLINKIDRPLDKLIKRNNEVNQINRNTTKQGNTTINSEKLRILWENT